MTYSSAHFINRELSWLAFDERVLEEAADATTPLFERLKFAAIAASNLDEFFMVRVAGLEHAIASGDTAEDLAGLTAPQQLAAVRERAHAPGRGALRADDRATAAGARGARRPAVGGWRR